MISDEGRWARKEFVLTRGRPVGYVPGTCNYDISSLSTAVMLMLWSQGAADLIVVVVKRLAYEGMETCLRVKLVERGRSVIEMRHGC